MSIESQSMVGKSFSEKEAAASLGVCKLTLSRARKRGEVSFFRIGSRVVYSEGHLRDYLAAREQRAVS